MRNRHITHLLTRYVHGQLRPSRHAQVINHVRTCPGCRAALAREEQVANDLRREMPHIGQVSAGQLSQVWAGVWAEIGTPRTRSRRSIWLPGLSVALAVLVVMVVALPLLAQSGMRAEAAPHQPRPISMSSPTPGGADETPDRSGPLELERSLAQPQATVAFVPQMAMSPVPVPGKTISPVAQYDNWQ